MQYVIEEGWYLLLSVWGGETGYVCMHVNLSACEQVKSGSQR